MANGRHFENRYIQIGLFSIAAKSCISVYTPYLSEKSSDFYEILYIAADFELDKRHVISFFLFLIWGGTRFLCLTGWPNAQPHGRNYCSVARHHQANLMVCVVCSCCATFPYREVCMAKGGIESGETLCHDIYPARPITTVSLATNSYCMMDGYSSCALRAPGSNLAVRVTGQAYSRRPSVISGLSSD